jgi:hypothetical protein
MALTNTELETALNAALVRIDQLEKLVRNSISTTQFNAATLLLETDLNAVEAEMVTTKARLTVAEAALAAIV